MIIDEVPSVNPILAGLSWMTVMNLKWFDPECARLQTSGPDSNGKYVGWILTLDGRPVINTSPFDTPTQAIDHLNAVIAAAKLYESPKVPTQAKKYETQSWFPFAQAHNYRG